LGFEKTASAQPGAELHFVPPLRELAETGRSGAITVIEDVDGTLRRYAVHFERQGWRIPSLPAKVAAHLGAALPAQADILLHWDGGPREREQYSYADRSEEHTSELQSRENLVCRLLLEKKKKSIRETLCM